MGDFVTLQRGHDLPESRRQPGDVPVLGSFGLTGWHNEARAPGPGVTVGRSGASFGVVSYSPVDYWPLNTALFVTDFHGNDQRFAYYFLQCFDFRRYNSGSAQPSLNRNYVHPIPVHIPPPREQRAIAHILGTLDDKLELNRQMNETLEEIARALFKSWFVDFDPVRAKAEGRDPGLPPHIADLFPDSFEDSELGEIPRGWRAGQLGDFVSIIKGRSYRSSQLVDGDTALVTLKSFARGGGYRPDGLKPYIGPYREDQVVQPGELLLAATDVTQAAEVIGRPALVRESADFRTLIASLDTLIVRPLDSWMTTSFLYFLCGSPAFTDHSYAHTTGTTVLHLAKEAVPSFRFATPPKDLVHVFGSQSNELLQRIEVAERESQMLTSIRGTLLPKLISGELSVPETEKIGAVP